MLKKHWKLISLMAVACLAVSIGAVATIQTVDQEKQISIEQVPAAVKATILAQAQGGVINEIEEEVVNGQTIYEAEVIVDGREVDIQVTADGTLLGTETENDDEGDEDADDNEEENEDEEEVALDAVPAAVKATILNEAAGAEIKEIEKEAEDGRTIYSAEVLINGQKVDFEIAPDGTLLGKEVENEDDDN